MKNFRIHRLCEAARHSGYDCLVASCPENIAYTSCGYQSIGQSVNASMQFYTVLSVHTGELSYVVSVADILNVLEFAGVETEIYAYGTFHFDFTDSQDAFVRRAADICARRYASAEEALCAAVQKAGTRPAFDETHINFVLAQSIARTLGLDSLSPASAIFREARRIKHPQEIDGIRESSQLAERALLDALKHAGVGTTEEDLETLYRESVVRQGGLPYFFVATAAHRSAFVDAHNTSLKFRAGDMIRFDFGCVYKGFYSDLARTAVIGHADPELEKLYTAVVKGAEAALDCLHPGIQAQEVFRAAVNETRRAGIPTYVRSHCGHGIGLEGYDVPSIAEGVQDILAENMVLCIETPYYRVGWGGVQIEHTVAITKDGYEFLDSGDHALIVVDN